MPFIGNLLDCRLTTMASLTSDEGSKQRAKRARRRGVGYRSKGCLVVATWNVESLRARDQEKINGLARKMLDLKVDLVNLIEINERAAVENLVEILNQKKDTFNYLFHSTNARANIMHLALIYRKSAFLDKFDGHKAKRFDGRKWNVPMTDPSNGRAFELAFRRGYFVTLHPHCTGHALVVVGVHLKSLRGNAFSHYKRMAQARVVRAALQNSLHCDWLVLGDFNSSSTDPSIAPIGDLPAAAARFQSLVPNSQRTFICDTLRTMDVRNPGYSLQTCHSDAAPTWRRTIDETGETLKSQLDHILYRFGDRRAKGRNPPHSDSATMCVERVERGISWLRMGARGEARDASDHAVLSVSLHFASKAYLENQKQQEATNRALFQATSDKRKKQRNRRNSKKKKKKRKKKQANN